MSAFICVFWFTALVGISHEQAILNPLTPQQAHMIEQERQTRCENGLYENTIDRIHYCR